MLATASGQLQSYTNADYAYVGGIEFEVTKKFNKIFKDKKILEHMLVRANAAYIYSQVYIDPTGGTIQTNDNRALQGAFHLVNFDLAYNNDKSRKT